MHRRDFISAFSKLSLVTAGAAMATSAVSRTKEVADISMEKVDGQVQSLKKRMDKMESNQKTMFRALIMVTALSTGLDLSIIL